MQSEKDQAAENGDSAKQLGRVLELLLYLKVGLDDVRAQLAGARKDHYTVEEIAQMVGRSPYTVRQWITNKRIDAVRVSGTGPKGRLLIPHDQIQRLIDSGLGGAIPAATC